MGTGLNEETLTRLLSFSLWTESEFVHVLCGLVPPNAPRAADGGDIEVAELLRDVERHVDDAIARGELRCQPRLADRQIAEALRDSIQDSALAADIKKAVVASRFYEPRRVRPDDAVQWALSRKQLFPRCPLTKEHFGFVLRAGVAGRQGSQEHERDKLRDRAKWLKEHLAKEAVALSTVADRKGPDRKTIHRILEGHPVGENVLNRLARALGVERNTIP